MLCTKNIHQTVERCKECISTDSDSCKQLLGAVKNPLNEIIKRMEFEDCRTHEDCRECENRKWCKSMINVMEGTSVEIIKAAFENGEYAHWIREFQERNPESISFSNRISALNNNTIQIESLRPLRIRSKDITPEDFENLSLLTEYFNYLKETYGTNKKDSIVISVGGKLYTLMEDLMKHMGEDTVILVVDTDDNRDENPVFEC